MNKNDFVNKLPPKHHHHDHVSMRSSSHISLDDIDVEHLLDEIIEADELKIIDEELSISSDVETESSSHSNQFDVYSDDEDKVQPNRPQIMHKISIARFSALMSKAAKQYDVQDIVNKLQPSK
eukprot:277746_1